MLTDDSAVHQEESVAMEVDRIGEKGWKKGTGSKGKSKGDGKSNFSGVKGKGKTKSKGKDGGKSFAKGSKGKQNEPKGKGKSTDKADKQCYRCGAKGHFAKDCWANIRNVQSGEQTQGSPSSAAGSTTFSSVSQQHGQQGSIVQPMVFDLRQEPISPASAASVRVLQQFYIGESVEQHASLGSVRVVVEEVDEDCGDDLQNILIDSGADAAVVPERFATAGMASSRPDLQLHDAQGRKIPVMGMRDVEVHLTDEVGRKVILQESVAVSAAVHQPILCFGRLMQSGWGVNAGEQLLVHSTGVRIPLELQHHSIVVKGAIRAISTGDVSESTQHVAHDEASGCVRAVKATVRPEILQGEIGWHLDDGGLGVGRHISETYQDPTLVRPGMHGIRNRTTLVKGDDGCWYVLELCEPLYNLIDMSSEFYGYEGELSDPGSSVSALSEHAPFAQFLVSECHKRPLCPDEPDFYRYLCHLKQEGTGATAGASLLQAWSFFRFMFGVDASSRVPLASGRVRGVVNMMFSTKRKLAQAPPIPADYVYRMERFMQTSRDDRLRTIVGFLLFCIYSCARFGDASKGDPKNLSFQEAASSDLTLVEISLSSYKTATGERRAILLPLIALGCGLDEYSWAMAWKTARKASEADTMGHLMSADSHFAEVWLNRRMTTAEGSYWTKDVLVMLGMEAEAAAAYSSHSLKATCLSWVSKAGNMSLQERLWLGHHESEEGKMAMTYARDALVASLIKLRLVVEAIKKGLFDPDLPRAERIAQATGSAIDPKTIAEKSRVEEETEEWLDSEELRRAAQLAESDVEDAVDVADHPIALPSEKLGHEGRHPFPTIDPSCCVRHRLSGIVHMISDVEKLSCGRKISCNMVPLENSFGESGQLEFCEQCRAVSGL
eukprot:s818_g12.t1